MSRAYSVGIAHSDDYTSTIFAPTAGRAKYIRLLELRDCGWEVSFQNLSCRSLGAIPVPPTRIELAQRECDQFNARFPVGTRLQYWSGLKERAPTGVAPIYYPATVVCESAVIWLEGVASCHSLTHVEPERDIRGASQSVEAETISTSNMKEGIR